MENYDPRRRESGSGDPRRYPHNEEQGRNREAWRPDDERDQRRAGPEDAGWRDRDRDYGGQPRYGDRERGEQQRYGRGSSERPTFSPDWSREGSEPRQSDDPYYSRNRDRDWGEPSRGGAGDYSRARSMGSREDERSRWEQRSRESIPREQRELAERSQPGDYYNPDWPYERSGRGRDMQRPATDDQQGSHYRGYYRSSSAPFEYPGGRGYLYSESITLHGPYSGRGPKGYKRSDQQIVEDASQRLERDGDIDASEIEVTAEDGVITLHGTVPDRRTKRHAEECVESVYGVRDVMNQLRCSGQSGQESQQSRSQESQGAQGQGQQESSGSQRSQSARGSHSAQSTTAAGQRPGAGSAAGGAERQGDDKNAPKH